MASRISLFYFLLVTVFSGFGQEDKVLDVSKDFFISYQKQDSVHLRSLFITKNAFWLYLNQSYIIGDLNDSMAARSAQNYNQLYELWWKDILSSQKKASEFYKIRWDQIEHIEYDIKYEERSNSGFMFQSYSVTIKFVYRKNSYSMWLDGFVVVDKQPYILANGLSLRKY
jgi:hypothetical protein